MDLAAISYTLQNPPTEADRLAAWGELKAYIAVTLRPEAEALELYEKYNNLDRDWTKETVS